MFFARSLARCCRGTSRRVVLRRCLGAILIAAYVVVAAGIPLPSVNRTSRSNERFPCESCGCGCDSAEHCWRNCCCHTLAERLVWAAKNGVIPPDFSLVEARNAGLDAAGRPLQVKLVKVAMRENSCCQTKRTCCDSTRSRSCCASNQTARNETKETAAATDFIIAFRALGCHGQSLHWLAAVPTLIAVELDLADQLPCLAWLGPHSSDLEAGVSDVPTPPPPERA